FTFDVGGAPVSLAVSTTGDDLYVLRDSGFVVAFQNSTGSPSERPNAFPIPVGSTYGALALSTTEPQRLVVAATNITVIDASTFGVLSSFAPEAVHDSNVYNFAVGVAIANDPVSPRAFVTYNTYDYSPIRFGASGGVATFGVFDNPPQVSTIPLFSLPGPIAVNGNIAFASIQWIWADSLYGAGFLPADWVASIDTSAPTSIVNFIGLGGDGIRTWSPAGLSVAPDGSAVFVAVPNMGGVAAIDATTGTRLQAPPFSQEGATTITNVAFVPNAAAKPATRKILAVDDAPAGSFPTGSTTPVIANVLANDTLGGAAAVAGVNVKLSASGTMPAGLSLDTATGAVWVLAGAAAGSQTFGYQICEISQPDNCASASVTVSVRDLVKPVAGNDETTTTPGRIAIFNVLSNDTFNGAMASLADVRVDAAADQYLSIDAWGSLVVGADTPAGVRSLTYRICERAAIDNCSNVATITVTVVNRLIVAGGDVATAPRTGATRFLNVLSNDSFDGAPIALGPVVFQVTSALPAGITVDAAGFVSVARGAVSGSLTYRISEAARPSNYADGNVSITVAPYVVSAVADSARLAPKNPALAIANVVANDSIGGVAAIINGNVSLSLVKAASTDKIVLNTATGAVNLLKDSVSGTYSLTYQICEIGTNNCAQAVVTIDLSGGGGGGGGGGGKGGK
ncbi:MAG TPA: hypothetical protein VNG89_05450, partial [Vicinamibacterales bacterium]|nr:hypothetical protein [Vicinamibacterales bacterium]